MINLSLSLEGQTITGCLTDGIEDEITMESSRTYQSASIDVGIEAGEEVQVEVGSLDLEIDAGQLEGTDQERIQFAADMTLAVVNNANEHVRQALANKEKGEQAICDLRAAEMKLAAVWPAVNEYLSELEVPGRFPQGSNHNDAWREGCAWGHTEAGGKVRTALRGLGLGPQEEESATGTD